MSKKGGVEYVQDHFSGDLVTPEKALAIIDNKMANGCSESAFLYLYALGEIAKEHDDTKLRRDVEKRINKIVLPYKYAPYRTEGAADPVNRKPKEKPLEVPRGKHTAFNFISNEGPDPYRLAQVCDLYKAMSKPKGRGNVGLIKADQRNFINIFTKGKTNSTVVWMGSIRELHYIVYQWKFREYIIFEGADEWVITSKLFTNPRRTVNKVPTYFDADDLRKAKNPATITQELENIVEILNPNIVSPNYDRFKDAAENRIKHEQRVRENKKAQQKPNANQEDFYAHIFDDDDEE